jgi:hypothetical protein
MQPSLLLPPYRHIVALTNPLPPAATTRNYPHVPHVFSERTVDPVRVYVDTPTWCAVLEGLYVAAGLDRKQTDSGAGTVPFHTSVPVTHARYTRPDLPAECIADEMRCLEVGVWILQHRWQW